MSSPPNILIVICDDLGVGDLSGEGNPITLTPHLDAFRSQGTSLRRHVSGPLCSPARACLLTGLYNQRSRVIDTHCGRSMLDPEVPVLSEVLRGAGYRTGCFGKWHLGDACPFRPVDRGFDRSVVHGSGGIGQPGDAPENAGRESYFDPVLCEDVNWREFSGFCTDIFADEAVRFMKAEDDRPWFAYVGFNAPHTPLQAPAERVESLRSRGVRGNLAPLYALVEGIDDAFGRMLDALEESGQAENTIVFFTSDHGPCPSVTDPDGAPRFNIGLRGSKGDVYEGGVRVPAYWRWPGGWPQGQSLECPTHVVDVMPTVLGCAGIAVPGGFDGMDLSPLLSGRGSTLPERCLFLQWHRGDEPVRYRNAAVWREPHKWLRVSEAGPDELYDLASDPAETCNLAGSEPGISEELRQAYDEWFDSVAQPHHYEPLRIHVGDSREPVTCLTRQDWRVIGPDGWSAANEGHWPIHVCRGGAFRIEIAFDEPPTERGSVVLETGASKLVLEAKPGEAVYEFPNVLLQDGPADISASLSTRFSWQSARLVRLSAL